MNRKNSNKHSRKRYHQVRDATKSREKRHWKKKNLSRVVRAAIRNELHHTSLEDDWDVYSWRENRTDWGFNSSPYLPSKDNYSKKIGIPDITPQEAKAHGGYFRNLYHYNLRSTKDSKIFEERYISWKAEPRYIDFEKLCETLQDIYFTEKFYEIEDKIRKAHKKDWHRNSWVYGIEWRWSDHTFKFPPYSLAREWLISLAYMNSDRFNLACHVSRSEVADCISEYGYQVRTNDQSLTVPIEERE